MAAAWREELGECGWAREHTHRSVLVAHHGNGQPQRRGGRVVRRRWVGEIEIENFTKKVAWTRSAAQERQAHDQAHGATNLKASTTPVTGGEARRWNSGSGPG